jgi:hypothetical protein
LQFNRKEKQIMRDTIKKNESKFGSKPMTPLAIKNKRKQLGEASHLGTPSMLIPNRAPLLHHNMSKLTGTTPGSNLGASRLAASTASSAVSTKLHTLNAKSKAINKRKSRTPGGKKRRSRVMMAQAAQNQMANADTSKLTQDTTLCSTKTYMQITSSTLSSTSHTSSHATSTSSLPSRQQQLLANNFAQKTSVSTSRLHQPSVPMTHGVGRHPPLSASAKYAAAAAASSTTGSSRNIMDRMTSTASNTFIEEESFTALELACNVTHKYVSNQNQASAAAVKISQMVADPNYAEFSVSLVHKI